MRGRQVAALALIALLLMPGQAAGVVTGSPEIDVSLAEQTVTPGSETELTVTLTNEGDVASGSAASPSLTDTVTTARSLDATLDADGAPVSVETGTRSIGSLPRGERADLGYDIVVADDASPGTYTLELDVSYQYTSKVAETTGARSERTETSDYDVTIRVDDRARFEILSVRSDVQAGSTGTADVRMRNTGSEPANATRVALAPKNADVTVDGSSVSRHVGTWKPGETKTLSYQVTAAPTAEQQRYAFTTTATFEDADGVTRTSETLPLAVTPALGPAFTLSNVSSTLQVGEEGTLAGTVTNDGETVARNAVVHLRTERPTLEPVSRAYAVGTLAAGETAEFEIDADVTSSADAGPRQFRFAVDYHDAAGDNLTSDDLFVRRDVAPGGDAFAVESVDAVYERGTGGELTVRVTNTAGETLSAVSAKLFADDPIAADSKEAFVTELAPGESTTVTFEVSAGDGALTKNYPVSVDLQYEDADGDTHVSDSHKIAVTVTEPESDDTDGGPLPFVVGGVVVAGLVGAGGYRRFRG